MKDGSTHLAFKPEHAVDLDTGVVVAAPIHPADEGDTTTLSPTLEHGRAQSRRSRVRVARTRPATWPPTRATTRASN